MNCFGQIDSNFHDDFSRTKRNDHSAGRLIPQRDDNNVDDNHSTHSEEDNHQGNISLHPSKRSTTAPDSQQTSRSNLDVPGSRTNQKSKILFNRSIQKYQCSFYPLEENRESKTNRSRTPSTRSFTSQRSQNPPSDMSHSWGSMNLDADDQSQRSDRSTPFRSEEDARSTPSFEHGTQ